jgi:RNA polymerase sigma-70 factor (ECF subfamily)
VTDAGHAFALERLFREEWGRILSVLIRDFGDFDLAEEVLQDAFASALVEWTTGPPANARGWLYTAARHNAIDRRRRSARFAGIQADLAYQSVAVAPPDDAAGEPTVPDERLRLMLTCCHPALRVEAQVALTLRTLGGLTTEEIARAFLVPTTTMQQRLVRAKAKIRDARIPYRLPAPEDLPERLEAVMTVIYLIFNEGYTATHGDTLVRSELCHEAIRLARLLNALLPAPAGDAEGLLALLLLQDSRRAARIDDEGNLVLLADQDRARWDHEQIAEGLALTKTALQRGQPGAYAIEAAIAAVHAEAASAERTDWRQIAGLYDRLYALHPSPIVALNSAVAVSMIDAAGPAAALPLVDALEASLVSYYLWHSTRADLLRRLGRHAEARDSYRHALTLAENPVERRFLERRLLDVSSTMPH